MGAFINLTGEVFSRLTVICRVENRGKNLCWLCRCECGELKEVQAGNLRSGHTKSCGCLRREVTAEQFTTHGMEGGRIYRSWHSMKQRCLNPKAHNYSRYGGRGVTVCPEWINSFEQFYKDMGDRPENTSLDRIDNSKGYFPENCRWATRKEQANNTRANVWLVWLGMRRTLAQWSEIFAEVHETSPGTFRSRLDLDWSCHQAMVTPIGSRRI